jgi:predicted flap endonuclease-1-like 5' DNA nuclease
MTARSERFAATLVAIAVVGTIAHLGRPPPRPLPGIDCTRAVMVDDTLRCGAETPQRLADVCGEGDGQIRPGDALSTAQACRQSAITRGDPGWARMQPDDLRALAQPVDINEADARELDSLPGVGPTIAGRIIHGRPYATIDHLERVKGIGPKTLAKMRARAVVQ